MAMTAPQSGTGDATKAMAYLPKALQGKPVLIAEDDETWRAVNDDLKADTLGLNFREIKLLEARVKDNRFLKWGETIQGVDEGDGWVRVPLLPQAPEAKPQPPARAPPQKASAFSGRGGFNPLRAFGLGNLIRGSGGTSASAPQTPRDPSPSSASAPNLPVVAKPPPTPPRSSRQRPTPRKGSTPRESSPQLPAVPPSPSRPGAESPREPEVSDSPLPPRKKDIHAPTNIVARSAPAAPNAPPGAPVASSGVGRDGTQNAQCREMMQVQGNALKLLNEIFDFPVTEEACVSILDQYPELAWLAHCMQRCPLPPCWTSVDGEAGGEARYIDMESGDMTEVQPLLKDFAELSKLMLQWRQAPAMASYVSTELAQKNEHCLKECERCRRVWTGPHTDPSTGMKFWHCDASGRSTWGDPGAASEFIARVAERLRRALPREDDETVPPPAPPVAAKSPIKSPSVSRPSSSSRSRPSSSNGKKREQSPRIPEKSETDKMAAEKVLAVEKAAVEASIGNAVESEVDEKTNEQPEIEEVVTTSSKRGMDDTGELIKARSQEVREMMAKISNSSSMKDVLDANVAEVATPSRAARSPTVPSPRMPSSSPPSGRQPKSSPRQPAARCPSPRTLASARKAAVGQDGSLPGWGAHGNQGVAGNRIYQEATAELRKPQGSWKPGACRPGPAARRRPESCERLQPLDRDKESESRAPSKSKQVTFLEKDGLTTRPGSDSPIDNAVVFIDESGTGIGAPPGGETTDDAVEEHRKASKLPRAGTPGRPKSRRGEDDLFDGDQDPGRETSPGRESPKPCTPGMTGMRVPGTPRPGSAQRAPGTPRRPRTPRASADQGPPAMVSDDVVIASPERPTPVPKEHSSPGSSSSSSSSSSVEAELVDVAHNSPLGNTGLAKDLCDVAIAAAVGNVTYTNEHLETTKSKAGVEIESHAIASITAGESGERSESTPPEDKASGVREANGAPLESTMRENDGSNPLGSTGAARQLCADAIDAVVSSAVDALVLGGTSASLLEDVECGNSMVMTFGGTVGLGNTRRTNLGGTLGATGDVPPTLPGEEKISFGNSRLGMSLRATGNIPQVAPGNVMPGDTSEPTTPRKSTMNFLKAALGNEDREPVSPSLMSISHHTPSPTKRDLESSFQGDSPSLIILEDSHWVPCKPLPPKQEPSKEKDERPVRCGSPAPLSARGRERHEREMAALLAAGKKGAKGSRPRGKGVRHLSVAGGA